MRNKFIISMGGLFFLVGIAALLFFKLNCNDLEKFRGSWQINKTQALADGGTLEIHLAGTGGRKLLIKRIGEISKDPSRQELRLYSGIDPFGCNVKKGSKLEALIAEALKNWLGTRLTPEQKVKVEINPQEALDSLPGEEFFVYHFLSWMGERE